MRNAHSRRNALGARAILVPHRWDFRPTELVKFNALKLFPSGPGPMIRGRNSDNRRGDREL